MIFFDTIILLIIILYVSFVYPYFELVTQPVDGYSLF